VLFSKDCFLSYGKNSFLASSVQGDSKRMGAIKMQNRRNTAMVDYRTELPGSEL
jgi:hypothetical protein